MTLHLSRLRLERYKAFLTPCEVEIRPLTIFMGMNNAGKSALVRAVPLLAGGLLPSVSGEKRPPLPLTSFGLGHGDSFEELLSGRSMDGSIRIEAGFEGNHSGISQLSLAVDVQNVLSPVVRDAASPLVRDYASPVVREAASPLVREAASPLVRDVSNPGKRARQVVTRWELRLSGGRGVVIERPELGTPELNTPELGTPELGTPELGTPELGTPEHRITITMRGTDLELRSEVDWSGLIPRSQTLLLEVPEYEWLSAALAALSEWARGVRYLGSQRELLESPFPALPSPAGGVGASGREAPRLLAIWASIQSKVRAWCRDTFNVDLQVRLEGESCFLEVLGEPGSRPISISQAGFGFTQALSVAVQCVAARRAGAGVDIIELPEAGLHPRAHAAVADWIVESLPGASRPLVLETHSEVLLLRIRRRIVENLLKPEDVVVYFVGRDDETGSAMAQKTEITAAGDVSNWPDGVFQEDYEEVVAIRREARRRGKDRSPVRGSARGPEGST